MILSGTSHCLFSDKYKTYKYSVGRTYRCWMLKLLVHYVTIRLQKVNHANRQLTVHKISTVCGIFYSICQAILTKDFNMWHISVKSVRCILTIKPKEHHLSVITNYPQELEMDQNFTKGFITGDETFFYEYDPETKSLSSKLKSPRSPRPKKQVHQVHAKVKIMLIVLFLTGKG